MTFINRSKFYEKKRWYCYHCDKVTKIKLNPKWVKAGKPYMWDQAKVDFEWFAKCSVCGWEHLSGSGFGCPNCGWYSLPEERYYLKNNKIINIPFGRKSKHKLYPIYGKSHTNNSDGSNSWTEIHFCPFCKKEFKIINA